jgi:hypothetical protein
MAAISDLELLRTRLGVLPGEPSHPNDGRLAALHEHQAHLQQDLEFAGNAFGSALLESLGTVATLQEESLTLSGLSQLVLEKFDFPGSDQRWQTGEFVQGLREFGFGGVYGLLCGGLRVP